MTSSSTTTIYYYQDKSNPTGGTAKSIEMSGELSLSSQHSNNHKNVELSGEFSFLDHDGGGDGGVSNHSTRTWSHKGHDPCEFSVASNRSTRTWGGGAVLGAIEKFNEKSGELSIRSNRTWIFAGNNNTNDNHNNDNNSNRFHRTNHSNSAASNRSNRTTSMEQQGLYYDDVSLLDNAATEASLNKASNRSSRTTSIRNRTIENASPGSSDMSLGKTETSNFSVSHFYGNGVTVSGGPPDETFIDEFGNSCSRYVNRTIVINDHMANYAASRSIQEGNCEDGFQTSTSTSTSSKRSRNSISFRYKATLFFFVASTLLFLLLLVLDAGKSDLQVSNTATSTSNKNDINVFEGNNEDNYHHIAGPVENVVDDDFFDEFAQDYSNTKNEEAQGFETKTARLFEGND